MDAHHEFAGEQGHHGELPHDPAPPDAPFDFWRNPLLPQGAGLAGISAASQWLLARAFRAHWMLGILALPVLGVAALLAAWAAAIHLTGGEKFDDHPWV
jgi:hypothetical protein